MITTPIAILLSSWPGLTRPSAHHRLWVDGRVKPGHDDKRMPMGVVIIGTWYETVIAPECAAALHRALINVDAM